MCSNSSLKSLSQLKTKFTWDHHRIGEKIYSNDSDQLLFFILILSAPGAGPFSGDFSTNLVRQYRAFSRALNIEKLKAPLFRGPEGAGATNDWCIISNKRPQIFHIIVCGSRGSKLHRHVSMMCENFLKANQLALICDLFLLGSSSIRESMCVGTGGGGGVRVLRLTNR